VGAVSEDKREVWGRKSKGGVAWGVASGEWRLRRAGGGVSQPTRGG